MTAGMTSASTTTSNEPVAYTGHEGGWTMAYRRSVPVLRAYLGVYYGWDEQPAPGRGPQAEGAFPGVVCVLNFADPFRITNPRTGDAAAPALGFLAGLDDGPAVSEALGRSAGVQFNLTPLGAWRLFGHPPAEISGLIVPVEDALGREGAALTERLACLPTWEARFDALDAFILGRVAGSAGSDDGGPPVRFAHAWSRIWSSRGGVDIGGLAREVGWSRQHLSVAFREHLGLAPKPLASVVRFHYATQRLAAAEGARVDWPALAAEAGYYDQAHLAREFRRLAGMTPTAYRAMHAPAVPDLAEV